MPDFEGYRRPGMTHLTSVETCMVGNPEFSATPTMNNIEAVRVMHGRDVEETIAVRMNPKIKWSDSFVINAW